MTRRAPTPEELAALDKRMGDWSVTCLSVLGVWIVLSPWVGSFTGYVWLTERLGGEAALLRVLLGFLFLYFAGIVREKNVMRETLRAFRTAAKQAKIPTREESVQAVDLLLAGLDSDRPEVRQVASENLRRMTGQAFGDDRDRWQAWWGEHRNGYEGPRKTP